jgi:hypothetical protein
MRLTRNEIIDRIRVIKHNVFQEMYKKKENSFSDFSRGALFGMEYALSLLLRTYPMLEDHKVWPEEMKMEDWIKRAIPFLKAELWSLSDCLAMPSRATGLGADWDVELDKKLEEDHAILTELLTEVNALED